jgi:pyruvate kinase
MKRRTKIVCTIGPASESEEQIGLLIDAGMNVARLNFSHGTHEHHRVVFDTIRRVAKAKGANVGILQDLQGPKMRTGRNEGGSFVELIDGEELTITTEPVLGTARRISTSYLHLPYDVHVGDRVLMADGTIELRVCRVAPPDVVCEVVRGGRLGEHKGINLPGVKIAEPSLTEKDCQDLQFGLELGVDFVALSFVRSPEDIIGLRELIQKAGSKAAIVAKIERPEALDCFDQICALTDVVMVARGDLGVEVDFADVPFIQKQLIGTCNDMGVPVITATQMLESMVSHSLPTRAEVTDVATAITDGTDAVMLSGETAAGDFPIASCAVMAKIAFRTDQATILSSPAKSVLQLRTQDLHRLQPRRPIGATGKNFYAEAIGQAVCRMATSLDVRRIICFTTTGYTAAACARFRPPVRITAITNSPVAQRRCSLIWGVNAILAEHYDDFQKMTLQAERLLLDLGQVNEGDTVILVAGLPFVEAGTTNLLKLHVIGQGAR